MFEDSLPPDIDVLAVTAADATEPSFACFYDAELGTFLADVFSISWMEDSESGGRGEGESLLEQIRRVRSRTAEWSHTSVYGDTAMETLSLATFQGDGGGEASSSAGVTIRDAVPATTADLVRLQLNEEDNEEAISRLLRNQQIVDRTYDNILTKYLELETNNTGDSDGELDRDCYFSVVRHVHEFCFNLGENSEALQKIQRLRGLCFKGDTRPASNGHKTLIKEVCYNL